MFSFLFPILLSLYLSLFSRRNQKYYLHSAQENRKSHPLISMVYVQYICYISQTSNDICSSISNQMKTESRKSKPNSHRISSFQSVLVGFYCLLSIDIFIVSNCYRNGFLLFLLDECCAYYNWLKKSNEIEYDDQNISLSMSITSCFGRRS